jgi:Fur family ferric uptake transcriptional regulator
MFNDYIFKLYNSGVKITDTRESVLSVFCENSNKHLSVEEVYDLVKSKIPSIGIATVYRSINLFVGLQIVVKIQFVDKITRYELLDENNIHYHLFCEVCGEITEKPITNINMLETQVGKESGFQLTAGNICLIGKCKKCSIKNSMVNVDNIDD